MPALGIRPVDSPDLAADLTGRGWSRIEGFFAQREVDAVIAAAATRRWPTAGADLLRWILDPRWESVATAVLGPDVRVLRQQVVTKAASCPATVPWHQDDAYGRVGATFVTGFVALDDMTVDNGCLRVLSGAHLDGPREHRRAGYLLEIPGLTPDDGEPIPLRRGDVLVFASMLPHFSGGNVTTGNRPAWMVQFCPADAIDTRTGEPVAGCPLVAAGGRWVDGRSRVCEDSEQPD